LKFTPPPQLNHTEVCNEKQGLHLHHDCNGSPARLSLRDPDTILDWNAIAVDTAITNGANPFAQARYAAIVQLAVSEAVNSITGDYKPYLGTIVAPAGASRDAAAAQAAHDVLIHYFTASQSMLDSQLAATLA